MPSKKKKYNARFPPVSTLILIGPNDIELNNKKVLFVCVFQARIKKIMQTDEEVGKVASAVPVIICILYTYSAGAFDTVVVHIVFSFKCSHHHHEVSSSLSSSQTL